MRAIRSRASCGTSATSPRVERNGEVSYRWKDTAREAFRDQGPRITFSDISDASIAAGLDLARAKWGPTVELNGSQEYKERALRLAVKRGMRVSNAELRDLQERLVREHERAQQPVRLDVVRVIERDSHAFGGEGLVVERLDAKTKTWSRADYPPLAGHIEFGKVHVVRVFANGRCDIDDDRTQNLRAKMARETEQKLTRAHERGIRRGGMSR